MIANSIRIVIAEAYGRLGKTAEAIAAYEKSLAEMAAWAGSRRRARSCATTTSAGCCSRPASRCAARRWRRAAWRSRAAWRRHGLDAIVEANRAHALVELGRFDEAKVLSEHAFASAEERKDTRWAGIFALYGAPAWCATGELARCPGMLAMAREKLKATLPPSHAMFGAIELAGAGISLREQHPKRRAIGWRTSSPSSTPPRTIRCASAC